MSDYLSANELVLRRDRNITDLIGATVLGADVLLYTYVVEAGDATVLRVTNEYTLSQAFLGSFGGFSLTGVDAANAPRFVMRRETGLTSPLRFFGLGGELLAETSHQGPDAVVHLVDGSGRRLLSVQREGNPLYPTYRCTGEGGGEIGVVDSKFNGLSEVFNKATRYELSFAPQATAEQRQALLWVGLYVDLMLHPS